MPKKPIDYAKCMFYRLVCRDPSVIETYVGHTTDESNRRRLHKNDCTYEKGAKYNLFVYRFIRDHGGFDNWQMLVHEKLAVADDVAARLRERYWCEFYKATLNKQVPGRTNVQSDAAWHAANKVHSHEKHDCPCGGKYTTNGKSAHFKTARHCAYIAALPAV